VLALTLGVAVLAQHAVALLTAGLTADWAADLRRRRCRIAFAQDLPTSEAAPVGELLDRIDDDVPGRPAGSGQGQPCPGVAASL
jgi:hypothetical protein